MQGRWCYERLPGRLAAQIVILDMKEMMDCFLCFSGKISKYAKIITPINNKCSIFLL